ncbi:MAG: HD domain-containing protein [Treponema sp.]|jgi:poly(A) polymerase|nr:HD domain-containing protein [Treponema sp.]
MDASMGPVMGLAEICSSLAAAGYSVVFRGFSAIDRFLGLPDLPFLWLETDADAAALAKLIENLRFPGTEIADAAVDALEATCYFRCLETHEKSSYSFPLLSFSYDWQKRRFYDPLGVYPLLKSIRKGETMTEMVAATTFSAVMDAALLLARYGVALEKYRLMPPDDEMPQHPPEPEVQRAFLNCLLVSKRPDAALEFLKASGLLQALWPELARFDSVDHSKEFHPEGNVWNHTLETFRYRKAGTNGAFDLRLSLGLLLHDAGKPISASFGSRRFDGHAELGARAARRFLKRLGYESALVEDIFYLVKNHMLPAALKRLPLTKTSEIMRSPLFPTLMELYRCDESSSFKPLDNYHENSAAYQGYLKNLRNPYRSADGKKITKGSMGVRE